MRGLIMSRSRVEIQKGPGAKQVFSALQEKGSDDREFPVDDICRMNRNDRE